MGIVSNQFGMPGEEGPVRDWAKFHPVAVQSAPARYRPVWHVDHLVFQAGVPVLRRDSLTGGGFLPMKDGFAGKQNNVWLNYTTPVSSQVGGGALPSRPNFLTRLLGGAIGPSQ